MPEIIDLYNDARQVITSTDKESPIPKGLNKLAVHIWIMNKKGQFLLQQRVASEKRFPNMWGQTGGGAQKGEDSWQCCVRESREELNFVPKLSDSVWVGTFKRPNMFIDIWLVKSDVKLSDLKLQPTEVQNVKWASVQEIEQMQKDGVFVPSIITGFRMVLEYCDMLSKQK